MRMMHSFVGAISGHVRALEQELDYLRKLAQEQKEIIEQLHRGYALPGRPTYIHPADLAEIFLDATIMEVFHTMEQARNDIVVIKGTLFKQSASMPKITTKI